MLRKIPFCFTTSEAFFCFWKLRPDGATAASVVVWISIWPLTVNILLSKSALESLLWVTVHEAHPLELMGIHHYKHTKESSRSEVAPSKLFKVLNVHILRRCEPRDSKKDYVKPSICCRNLTSNSLNLSSPHYSAAFLSTNAYSRMGAFGMKKDERIWISIDFHWVVLSGASLTRMNSFSNAE